MGRNTLLISAIFLVGCNGAAVQNEFAACAESDIILLPHHAFVDTFIEDMYEVLAEDPPAEIIIISPDHFSSGDAPISKPNEQEHGFTLHRDFAKKFLPDTKVSGWMIARGANTDELIKNLTSSDATIIFSIDFSHYLPGEVAYVHDRRASDVIEAGQISEASTLEVDSPESVATMLSLLALRDEHIKLLKNTNPSLDGGFVDFENTSHFFGCNFSGPPSDRMVKTSMYFTHPEEFYLGLTEEDRYLYGYDQTFFDQGGLDTAVIEYGDGSSETFEWDFFDML